MGTDSTFDDFARSRWPRLVRAAVLMGADSGEAEDLAQNALTKAWRSWDRVSGADEPDAYVYRILANAFTDSRRRKWHGERPTERLPEALGVDASDDVVAREAMRAALSNLNADQRTVVVLRFYAQMSEAQMSRTLGVAPGTVKSRLARALRALRAHPALAHEGTLTAPLRSDR